MPPTKAPCTITRHHRKHPYYTLVKPLLELADVRLEGVSAVSVQRAQRILRVSKIVVVSNKIMLKVGGTFSFLPHLR